MTRATITDLVDALESAGRAFDTAQARLYGATYLHDVRRVLRHEGRAWGIADRQLYLRALDGGWYRECYADGGGDVSVRRASDTLSIVAEHDDEYGCTLHVVTTALRDDGAARICAGLAGAP